MKFVCRYSCLGGKVFRSSKLQNKWHRRSYSFKRKTPYILVIFILNFKHFLYTSTFYPALMGSKTPASKFSESKEVRWGINCP
ncbi:hypothetical protein CN540_02565 [Bacillus toyonensis]|uniref:Uncharacterized protein n=1 Tax=Bacillus toyonensis TaxID=155322 RepID=A0AB36T1Q3_9BACI|nr:hypothetical protein CON55_10000 [Bacillus toyonensis]PED89749.1 hypothetical protein CON90_29305 [Bacillus toyonensis]PEL58285.1 hypothetical protein CN633_16675 [Bacillus toyonensis]PEN60845.1 hypothetical protein CN540_02565 [Bacillus toyonensis]PEN86902.1 hypothetical protein CN551_19385 [Bacillus toyonensis]